MVYNNMGDYLKILDKEGELLRVKDSLAVEKEISAALRYFDCRDGRAVMFEAVKGYSCPVVGDLFSSRKRFHLALETDKDLTDTYLERAKTLLYPTEVNHGQINEVILEGEAVDINRVLPVLTHHAGDVGPYITTGVVICRHPVTGERAVGIHRIQVKGPNKIGVFLASPPVAECFRVAEEQDKSLPFVVVIGLDPVTFLASIAWAPEGLDKFALAGALRLQPLEVVKCRTADLQIPAHAEFALEGEFLPHIREKEGPFAESTGYYLTFNNPVGKISCITHSRDPIYHALMPFNNENTLLCSVLWEASQFKQIRQTYPQIQSMRLRGPIGDHAVIRVGAIKREQVRNLINGILETYPRIKGIIIVDEDVNIDNVREIEWAVATRFQPAEDMVIIDQAYGSAIDPSAKEGKTSKWGIIALRRNGHPEFDKIEVDSMAYQKVNSLFGT